MSKLNPGDYDELIYTTGPGRSIKIIADGDDYSLWYFDTSGECYYPLIQLEDNKIKQFCEWYNARQHKEVTDG